jgi:acetyl esterase/lipase
MPRALPILLASLVAAATVEAQVTETPTISRDLAYVPNGHARQVLDLYLPPAASRPLPLIVAVHGGAWQGGDKARNQQVAWLIPRLLEAGYAVAAVNHRYSQQAVFPAQVHDVKAALRWLRAHAEEYGLDSARIGAWGESSGAHLAAMLGTSAGVPELDGTLGTIGPGTRVRAVVDWYGPTDFLQMDAHRLPDGMVHDGADSPESRLVGGAIQTRRTVVEQANPITHVNAGDPPFLIFHGDRDPLVPHHQSVLLQQALSAAGVEVTLRTLAGAGHGTGEFRSDDVAHELIAFFDRHVKGGRR